MATSEELTVDYKKIQSMSFGDRRALTRTSAGIQLISQLAPGQIASLFPSYYREKELEFQKSGGGEAGTVTPVPTGRGTGGGAGGGGRGEVSDRPAAKAKVTLSTETEKRLRDLGIVFDPEKKPTAPGTISGFGKNFDIAMARLIKNGSLGDLSDKKNRAAAALLFGIGAMETGNSWIDPENLSARRGGKDNKMEGIVQVYSKFHGPSGKTGGFKNDEAAYLSYVLEKFRGESQVFRGAGGKKFDQEVFLKSLDNAYKDKGKITNKDFKIAIEAGGFTGVDFQPLLDGGWARLSNEQANKLYEDMIQKQPMTEVTAEEQKKYEENVALAKQTNKEKSEKAYFAFLKEAESKGIKSEEASKLFTEYAKAIESGENSSEAAARIFPASITGIATETATAIGATGEMLSADKITEIYKDLGINLTGGAESRGYSSSLDRMNPAFLQSYRNAIKNLPPELAEKIQITSAFRDPNDPEIIQMYEDWKIKPDPKKPMSDPRTSQHGKGNAFDITFGNLSKKERDLVVGELQRAGFIAPVKTERWYDSHTHLQLDPNITEEQRLNLANDYIRDKQESITKLTTPSATTETAPAETTTPSANNIENISSQPAPSASGAETQSQQPAPSASGAETQSQSTATPKTPDANTSIPSLYGNVLNISEPYVARPSDGTGPTLTFAEDGKREKVTVEPNVANRRPGSPRIAASDVGQQEYQMASMTPYQSPEVETPTTNNKPVQQAERPTTTTPQVNNSNPTNMVQVDHPTLPQSIVRYYAENQSKEPFSITPIGTNNYYPYGYG